MKKFKLVSYIAAFFLTQSFSIVSYAEDVSDVARSHGFFAVKEILDQEKNLDKILIIKGPKKSIGNFMKQVAKASDEVNEELDAWFKKDPSLIAKNNGFPPVEITTRDKMTSDTTKSMVFTGSKNFEVRAIVSQIQATDYLSHGFAALHDSEKNETRKKKLKSFAETFEKLNGQGYQLLGAKK